MVTISTEVVNCGKCPNLKTGNFYSTDGWDRMEDWMCKLAEDRKIAGAVEWHEEKKIKIPDWCPLREAASKKEEEQLEKPKTDQLDITDLQKRAAGNVDLKNGFNKVMTYKGVSFVFNVRLNYKVERRMNGNRWHQISVLGLDTNYVQIATVKSTEMKQMILAMDNAAKMWVDKRVSEVDILTEMGFK